MNRTIVLFTLLFSHLFFAQTEKKIYDTENFSIKYPLSWNIGDTKGTQAMFVAKSPLTSKADLFAENVNLITQNLKGNNITLDQYVAFNESQLKTIPQGKIFLSKRETRNGKDYHILVFSGIMSQLDLKAIQVYAIKNEIAYVLTFTTKRNEFNEWKDIGFEIMKSFNLK